MFFVFFTPCMKITVKKLPKSEVEIKIEVSDKTMAASRKKVLTRLAHEKKISGFRPGHIPEALLTEKLGENFIHAETIEATISATYEKAVIQEQLRVIDMPRIALESNKPLVYVATVAVFPEFSAPPLAKIKMPKPKEIKVDKKELEEAKKMLAERMAEVRPVERAAKKDDIAEIDFEGFDEEGKPLPNTASKHHPVEIGSGAFIPGFEEALIGLKAGENKEFTVVFPADYGKKDFQNKKVLFKIKVHNVLERFVPPFDEALIEKLTGQKKTMAEMDEEIKQAIFERHAAEERKRREGEFLDNLAAAVKIDLPLVLIERETENMIERLKEQVVRARSTWEKHLTLLKKTEEEVRKDLQKQAEKNVLMRLAFQEVLHENKPQVADNEVEKRIADALSALPADQKASAAKHFAPGGNGREEILWEITVEKFFDQLFAEK